jgi:hypothetical protein
MEKCQEGKDSRKTSLRGCGLARYLQDKNVTVIVVLNAPALAPSRIQAMIIRLNKNPTAAIASVDRLDHWHVFLSARYVR